jgi:hypothetical protein
VTTSDFQNAPSSYASALDVSIEGEVRQLPVGSAFDEMGATGLKRSSGVIDEEFLPALKGSKAVAVFREMSSNDYTVGSLLFAIEMLLRQVEWTVVGDDTAPESQEAVQFVEECMDDMSHSWNDLIAEILSMLVYGWSWHEIVYKKRVGPWEKDPRKTSKFTDGKIGWRKMPIRSQETLFRWLFDEDGGIKGMVQIPPPKYQQIPLNIEKGLLFRTGIHKGNPEGRSILRNAYRPWYFKKRLEEFEAIGVERDLAGLPVAKVPSQYMGPNATPDQKAIYSGFKKLVANVRRDEHEGVVIPSDMNEETKTPLYEFELLSSGGSRTFDTNTLIARYELAILSVVLGDFIKLGHEGEGSYAMHVDKTGIFRAALNTIAMSIADTFNRYAIPRLFALNGWKLDSLPRIEPSNVDPPNLTELAGFMSSMANLGMTFFPDPDLEKYLRDTAHLPPLSEEQEQMKRQMAEQTNAMDYVQTHLQAEGVKQKTDMVAQGMTPEQAEMQSQMPTEDMQAQEQAQAEHQAMLDGAGNEQKLDQTKRGQDAEFGHKQRTADLEFGHKKRMDDQNVKTARVLGDVKDRQARMALEVKRRQNSMDLQKEKAKQSAAKKRLPAKKASIRKSSPWEF